MFSDRLTDTPNLLLPPYLWVVSFLLLFINNFLISLALEFILQTLGRPCPFPHVPIKLCHCTGLILRAMLRNLNVIIAKKIISGGIFRFKHHLAGTKEGSELFACPKKLDS